MFDEIGNPKKLIVDPGKEFDSEVFKKMCLERDIMLHFICAENHSENGRIERLNRELWQAIRKTTNINPERTIDSIVEEFQSKHNETYHRGIKRTPKEAWENPKDETLRAINMGKTKYAKEFIKGKQETFEEGDKVAIEATTIEKQKKRTTKFNRTGEILMKLRNNTYLVKARTKLVKKAHSQLKKLQA